MIDNRRQFFQTMAAGFGGFALADLLGAAPTGPHFAPKAKHVIFLFMAGGPSQMDMFDPKPALLKYQGQRPPSVDLRTERVTGGLLPSPFAFKRHGRNGIELSELLPQMATVIDDVCVMRGVYTFNPTHTPARSLIHTGNIAATRPSMGAWISHGLGSENKNLPGFVVISGGASASLWRAGFLPAEHQGTLFNQAENDPDKMIRYLRNAKMNADDQRKQLDLVQALNAEHKNSAGEDAFLEGKIAAMETAYRMQFTASDVFNLKAEPESIREMYGTGKFAEACLIARRLVERGVRYTHIYYGNGQPWDDHAKINKNLRERCPDMDRASAALIRDLKQRGLLDDTLIVWGGEFGRTPVSENGDGRDHNPYGFTMWMAGGGVKGGIVHGATDEFGFKAIEGRVSIHDLHATILHQLGLDHEKLTYRYAGRDFRLTDVHGQVVREILL